MGTISISIIYKFALKDGLPYMITAALWLFVRFNFHGRRGLSPSLSAGRLSAYLWETCQISSAYSRIALSEENLPAFATFLRHFLPNSLRFA